MSRAPKTSLVDDAYLRLKQEILHNRMPPGFQAPEPEVAQNLQMSRTPVREALVRLQSEGLVDLVPRRGVRVRAIAPNDMREIYELLTLLEPEAAAQVAKTGLSREQLAKLEQANRDMEYALAQRDLDAWAAADDRFHRALLDCHGNSRLSTFVNMLFDQAHRARMVTLRLRKTPLKSTEEHMDILKAIADADADRTRTIFRAHRERTAQELLSVLGDARLSAL